MQMAIIELMFNTKSQSHFRDLVLLYGHVHGHPLLINKEGLNYGGRVSIF